MGLLQIGIIVLTLATAIIHLQLVFPSVLFILNGLGYLGLLGALYLPIPQLAGYRPLVCWALVGYTRHYHDLKSCSEIVPRSEVQAEVV
jgi:hypothetical protein